MFIEERNHTRENLSYETKCGDRTNATRVSRS